MKRIIAAIITALAIFGAAAGTATAAGASTTQAAPHSWYHGAVPRG